MVTTQRVVLDRVQALTLARNLILKRSSEVGSLAINNPTLLEEWLDELESSREQALRDLQTLDRAIAQLHAAQSVSTKAAA